MLFLLNLSPRLVIAFNTANVMITCAVAPGKLRNVYFKNVTHRYRFQDYLVFGLEISQPGCKKYPTPAAQTAPAAPDDFTGGSAHASNQLNQTNQMNQMSESIKRIDELENVQKQ